MPPRQVAHLLDAHVHLAAYPEPAAVVRNAEATRTRLLSVTVSPSEAAQNMTLREEAPSTVRCFIGIHPSEALASQDGLEKLADSWESADGIGEIGLDPKYSEVSKGSIQTRLFTAQLEVAERLQKPVQVHSRGAEEACLDLLEGRSLAKVLLHWFQGEALIGRVISGREYYVSFGPGILYSKQLREIARRVPPQMVLTESDGPVSFAALGGAQGPGLIPSVVFKLADLWEMSFDDALAQLALNEKSYLE